jgi:hypothetical protein
MTRRLLTALTALCALAAPAFGAPTPDRTLVNPFDFARDQGVTITTRGDTWTLRRGGRTLVLRRDSDVALVDGKRVRLGRVVAYARGVLLAPRADLARALGVKTPTGPVSVPARVGGRPDALPAPADTTRPSALVPAPPERAPTPAPRWTAPASRPGPPSSPAGRPGPSVYVLRSELPLLTTALDRNPVRLTVGPERVRIPAVVAACGAALARPNRPRVTLDEDARVFVLTYPEDTFVVRTRLKTVPNGQGPSDEHTTETMSCVARQLGSDLLVRADRVRRH